MNHPRSVFSLRRSASAVAGVSVLATVMVFSVAGCSPAGGGGPVVASGGSSGQGSGGSSLPGSGGSATGGSSSPGSGGSATGGAVGSGGAPGSGGGAGRSSGSGGNAATGGAGGSGSGGASGVTPFFTADFESATAGQQPSGWDNFIAWVKNGANPQGETLALVDGTRAHGGRNSVHFHGGGNPALLTRPLPPGTNKLYVRAFFYLSRKLGMNPGANHETLLGIRKSVGSAGDEIRFGEIKGVIGTNESATDNIAPKMAQWGLGPVVAANKWTCIEVAFVADQPQHVLQAWADGVMVHSITAGDQWQNGPMPMNWLDGKFAEFIVGWHSFSSATVDVWMDDLALSTGPIGCN